MRERKLKTFVFVCEEHTEICQHNKATPQNRETEKERNQSEKNECDSGSSKR